MTAHWGIEDPAAIEGTPLDKERAFNQAFQFLRNRIAAFTALRIKSLEQLSLAARLHDIAMMEGTPPVQPKAEIKTHE